MVNVMFFWMQKQVLPAYVYSFSILATDKSH